MFGLEKQIIQLDLGCIKTNFSDKMRRSQYFSQFIQRPRYISRILQVFFVFFATTRWFYRRIQTCCENCAKTLTNSPKVNQFIILGDEPEILPGPAVQISSDSKSQFPEFDSNSQIPGLSQIPNSLGIWNKMAAGRFQIPKFPEIFRRNLTKIET